MSEILYIKRNLKRNCIVTTCNIRGDNIGRAKINLWRNYSDDQRNLLRQHFEIKNEKEIVADDIVCQKHIVLLRTSNRRALYLNNNLIPIDEDQNLIKGF